MRKLPLSALLARRLRLLLIPTLLVVALSLAACSPRFFGDDDDDGGEVTAPTPEATATVNTALPDADGDGVPDQDDLCPSIAETGQWTSEDDGCPDTIDDLVVLAANELDAFWEGVFEQIGEEYRSPRSVAAYDRPRQTACGETVPDNAFYCQADHSIFFDQALFDESLASIGDFAPVFILAHEWGHLVQGELGFLAMRDRAGIRNELQADCFAGLFTRHVEDLGMLEPGDTDEALEIAFEAGDPSGARQSAASHGTSEQRQKAFAIGYTQSLSECLAI